MNAKFLCFLTIAMLSVGCSRQRGPSTVSAAGTVQAATTAPAANQVPAGDPEPVAPPATLPQQAAPPSAATATQAPVGAQPTAAAPPAGTVSAGPTNSPFPSREPQAADVQPAMLIPARTRIRVRLGVTLDTRDIRPGERFVAYLSEPIVSGDRVVVPKGTAFEGHVIEAKRSGRLRGRAYLGITLDSFRLHGARYALVTAPDFRSSRSHKRRNFAFIGGGSGAGATIGAVAGGGVGALIGAGAGAAAGTTTAFITGKKDVRLPVETPLVFRLRSAVAVHG